MCDCQFDSKNTVGGYVYFCGLKSHGSIFNTPDNTLTKTSNTERSPQTPKMKTKSKQKSKSPAKKPSIDGSWSKVKIAGNLITNDGGGLEGLVGLEVLENYDKNIIAKTKVKHHVIVIGNVCVS